MKSSNPKPLGSDETTRNPSALAPVEDASTPFAPGANPREAEAEHTVVDTELARRLAEESPAEAPAQGAEDEADLPALEVLGPAFAEPDSGLEDLPQSIAESSEAATAAKPGFQPVSHTRKLEAAQASEPAAADDGWAGFEDKEAGWRNLTGQSQVVAAVEPAVPAARRPAHEAAPGPKELDRGAARYLVCTAGRDAGERFALSAHETTIGRSPACAIALRDVSVSREHAQILRDDEVYSLIDLRSANGTFVNGERIDRARLHCGDALMFGSAAFCFTDGDGLDKVELADASALGRRKGRGRWQSSNRASVVASGAILAVTALVAVAIAAIRGGTASQSRRETLFGYHVQAVEAFKRRAWVEADHNLTILLGLDPGAERARLYLEEVAKEKQTQKQLEAARKARQDGNLVQAYTLAATINDSVYTPDAEDLLEGIEAELDAQVTRAKAALAAGRADEALQLLSWVDLVRPGRSDANAVRARALHLRTHEGSLFPRSLERGEDRAGAFGRPAGRPSYRRRAASPIDRAVDLFADGQSQDAIDELARVSDNREAALLSERISKFIQVYEDAIAEHRAKRAESAIQLLSQAKALDAKIAGGRSRFTVEINRRLADMYYVQGVEAALGDHLPEAYLGFRNAIALDPKHDASRRKLAELADKARALLNEGVSVRETNPQRARECWRLVLAIVPPDHESYRKAKSRLDALP